MAHRLVSRPCRDGLPECIGEGGEFGRLGVGCCDVACAAGAPACAGLRGSFAAAVWLVGMTESEMPARAIPSSPTKATARRMNLGS